MQDSQNSLGSAHHNLDKWNRNQSNHIWLTELLSDSRMVDLLSVLQEQGIPRPIDVSSLPEDSLTRMALLNAQHVGYYIALRNLQSLASVAYPVEELSHEGWQGMELQDKFGMSTDQNPA